MIYINLNNFKEFYNILFIVSAGLSLCFKYNISVNNISFITNLQTNLEIQYETFKNIKISNNNNINNIDLIKIFEPIPYNYNEIHLNPNMNYLISGTFYSYKYSDGYIDKIKEYLNIHSIPNVNLNVNSNIKRVVIFINNPNIENIHDIVNIDHNASIDLIIKCNVKCNVNSNVNYKELQKKLGLEKYKINIIKEYDDEKIFYLMLNYNHYIIQNSNLALIAYYFRTNRDATITLLSLWSDKLISYEDIVPIIKSKVNKLDNTFIINLESRVDRRILSLENVNLIVNSPVIFKGIYNKYGAYGASMSHISLLKKAINDKLKYICIIEDDIKISYPEYVLNSINEIMKIDNWDVIIIGGKIIKENTVTVTVTVNYNRVIECQTMTGYIVNSHYYSKLLNNFTEGLNKFLRDRDDTKYAIDIYWKSLQTNDNWFTPKYKYVSQESGFSDITTIFINYNINNKDFFDSISNFDYLKDKNYKCNIMILPNFNFNKLMINFIKDYPYLILNNYCYKIPSKFIPYSNSELIKLLNSYDIVQLQFNLKDISKDIFKSNIIYRDDHSVVSNAILINNKVIQYIIKNNIINFNKLDFNKFKTCRLAFPIFLASNDRQYLDYYNEYYK